MKCIGLLFAFLLTTSIKAQDISFSKSGMQVYQELPNPKKTDSSAWARLTGSVFVSYASDNVRYEKEKPPKIKQRTIWTDTAWKGEKIHTQLLVWSKRNIPVVSVRVSALRCNNGDIIPSSAVKARFVRYTMADKFVEGCSQKSSSHHDSLLVEDPIDIVNEIRIEANTVQPIWLNVEVPRSISAGKYSGTITIIADRSYVLSLNLVIQNQVLPPAAEWKYDFDIWQYPAPIARIHNVPLWSDEHFKLMRQYFSYLAGAGQKVITANIIEQPWGWIMFILMIQL